jgi:hypothetical protein
VTPLAAVRRAPWTPKRITGLAWDYDAARVGLADGVVVASLTDFGPSGFHAVQATESRKPTKTANALNGRSGLTFTAAQGQRLVTPAFASAIPQPVTMFMVGKANGDNQYLCDGIAVGNRMAILRTSTGDWGLVTQGVQLSGVANDGEYAIICAVFNGASSKIRVNGVETRGTLGADELTGLIVGSNQPSNLHLDGVVIRHFGYNRLLTETEIARCERYLRDRTAIDVGWEVLFPQPRYVYQRMSPSTDLLIEGVWQLFDTMPTGIEVRYKGGAWTNIGATINADGTWSGVLPAQTDGQGTLEVRRADVPADTRTVAYVGVGDVFLVAGQSNAEGHFDNNQVYSHGSLVASLWRQTSSVPDDLTDPTDSDSNDGSAWPPLATHIMADQNVPVMFVTAAQSGSGLLAPEDWRPDVGDAYTEAVEVVANARHSRLKGVLWYQGENDAAGEISTEDYKAALSDMLDALQIDTGFDLNDDPLVEDSFTAANGTNLHGRTPDTGPANWVVRSGTWQIQSGKVVGVAPDASRVATIDTGETDVRIRATMNNPDNDSVGFVFRYNPADGTHYLCLFQASSGGTFKRMKVLYYDGASYTEIAFRSTTITPNTDHDIEAAINGPHITMRFGSVVRRYETATNNPTQDHHGIFSNADGTIDDLTMHTIVHTPLVCAQIGRRTDAAGGEDDTDAIRTAQYELPDEDDDVLRGPLAHDQDFADEVHWSTDGQAAILAGRWWRAIEDAFYGGNNGTGPEFVSAAAVDPTHTDVTFSFPGSATSMALDGDASDLIGWRLMDSGVQRAVSAVALQSATVLRLTHAAITGVATISFGHGNESAGTSVRDNHAYPLPPVPFLDQAVA